MNILRKIYWAKRKLMKIFGIKRKKRSKHDYPHLIFTILINNNIICKRNWRIKHSNTKIKDNCGDVIKLLESKFSNENAKFHHNITVSFECPELNIAEICSATLHSDVFKIDIKDILEDIRHILKLQKIYGKDIH